MERKGFAYEVFAEVLLTVAEVTILMELSATHYDGVCKGAGKCGGFLYGVSNNIAWSEECGEQIPSKLSWRNVDTMCKILEQSRTDEERSLYARMCQLLSSMSDEQRKMNNLP